MQATQMFSLKRYIVYGIYQLHILYSSNCFIIMFLLSFYIISIRVLLLLICQLFCGMFFNKTFSMTNEP